MRFLFLSGTGSNLSLAQRVSEEGHYTVISSNSSLGKGIVNQTPFISNIRHTIRESSPDVIVYDDTQHTDIIDAFRKQGKRIAFSSLWSKVLKKQDYQQDIIKAFGFTSYTDQKGTDFTIEGWFNGHKFIASYLAKVYNRLQTEDAGPKVISPGAVIWGNFTGKLYNETLGKIEKMLRKVTYRGPVSITIIVNKNNIYVKSIKAQPVRSTFTAFFEGIKENVSDILLTISSGDNIKKLSIDNWIVSIGISIPPWPYNSKPINSIKLKGLTNGVLKHIWFEDVKKINDDYVCAGCSGLLGYITARGTSIKEARRRIKRTLKALDIKDLQYRSDIGKHDIKDYQQLYNQGWIKFDKSLYPNNHKRR